MTSKCCEMYEFRWYLLFSSVSIPLYFLCASPFLVCVLYLLFVNSALHYSSLQSASKTAELAEAQMRLMDLEQTLETLEVPVALHQGDLSVLQKLTYPQLCSAEESLHKAVGTVRELKDIAMKKQLEVAEGLCAVCLWNSLEVLFLPCRHLCCCSDCAPKVTECPVCKRTIAHREKIYM